MSDPNDPSDPFAEQKKIEQQVMDKLAEIGVDVQPPIFFGAHPSGDIVFQPVCILRDPSQIQSNIAEHDEFAAIVEAEKRADLERKLEEDAQKAAEAEAGLDDLIYDDDEDE